ncbi:MAG: M15 family metallopeptidase [Myxococcales bacterium]|nr:M15 family metallopeptidase [Myxococcales bacterium]MBL0192613.1 M15 family metallopeptidase [Myxococcales bacterium]
MAKPAQPAKRVLFSGARAARAGTAAFVGAALLLAASASVAEGPHAGGHRPGHKPGPTAQASAAAAPKPRPTLAPDPPAEESPRPLPPLTVQVDGKPMRCLEQPPQAFLIRGNWFKKGTDSNKALAEAIKYRTEHYGYFPGFGSPSGNAHPPRFYAEPVSFMGMTATVNKHVGVALRCVEAALQATPAKDEYHPHSMGGIRFSNTYRGSEISNHVYGIAIDIEPHLNTCCGCVAPWTEHPLCQRRVSSIYERMAMPKSWVAIFERFGFYWLGHDVLQDTMHFEFLGDPTKIVEPAPAAPASAPTASASSSSSAPSSPPSGAAAPGPTAAPAAHAPPRPR